MLKILFGDDGDDCTKLRYYYPKFTDKPTETVSPSCQVIVCRDGNDAPCGHPLFSSKCCQVHATEIINRNRVVQLCKQNEDRTKNPSDRLFRKLQSRIILSFLYNDIGDTGDHATAIRMDLDKWMQSQTLAKTADVEDVTDRVGEVTVDSSSGPSSEPSKSTRQPDPVKGDVKANRALMMPNRQKEEDIDATIDALIQENLRLHTGPEPVSDNNFFFVTISKVMITATSAAYKFSFRPQFSGGRNEFYFFTHRLNIPSEERDGVWNMKTEFKVFVPHAQLRRSEGRTKGRTQTYEVQTFEIHRTYVSRPDATNFDNERYPNFLRTIPVNNLNNLQLNMAEEETQVATGVATLTPSLVRQAREDEMVLSYGEILMSQSNLCLSVTLLDFNSDVVPITFGDAAMQFFQTLPHESNKIVATDGHFKEISQPSLSLYMYNTQRHSIRRVINTNILMQIKEARQQGGGSSS